MTARSRTPRQSLPGIAFRTPRESRLRVPPHTPRRSPHGVPHRIPRHSAPGVPHRIPQQFLRRLRPLPRRLRPGQPRQLRQLQLRPSRLRLRRTRHRIAHPLPGPVRTHTTRPVPRHPRHRTPQPLVRHVRRRAMRPFLRPGTGRRRAFPLGAGPFAGGPQCAPGDVGRALRPGLPGVPGRHDILRSDTRSASSRSDSSVRADSPEPRIASASARLDSSIRAMRSSTVPSVTRRWTWTGWVCPMR